MSLSFGAWLERNLDLQSLAYKTVVLIDANNTNATLQCDAGVSRRAVACAEREFGADGGQPLVIAFSRPAFPNVNLSAGSSSPLSSSSSSSFQNSCDVPEFDQPHFLRVVACSSYIMQARGSMNRPRCSVHCDDVANLGYYHNTSTSPRQRFDGSVVRLPRHIDDLDRITEDTCQLDDYLMAAAAYILTKLRKTVITVTEDKRFTEARITIPELVYPFVCVLAPCAVSAQPVCAHPVFQADLAQIRDAIGNAYPHPQYNKTTIQRYKSEELELERARNAQFSRWTDAPDFLMFQEGQRKLAAKFGRALRGRKQRQTIAQLDPSRSAGPRRNQFDKLERPDPTKPHTRFVDVFSGPPGLAEKHQGQRQQLAAILQELRLARGDTTPLEICSRMRNRYSELDPNSQQSDTNMHEVRPTLQQSINSDIRAAQQSIDD